MFLVKYHELMSACLELDELQIDMPVTIYLTDSSTLFYIHEVITSEDMKDVIDDENCPILLVSENNTTHITYNDLFNALNKFNIYALNNDISVYFGDNDEFYGVSDFMLMSETPIHIRHELEEKISYECPVLIC